MKVIDIIRAKGSRVITVPPYMKLRDVAKRLSQDKIGSVVVAEPQGKVLGLVSERTIIEAFAERGADCLEQTAGDVMLVPPPSCQAGDSIRLVMEEMTRGRNRHLLAWHEGELAGIISIGDVVKARISDTEMENSVLRDVAAAHIVARV